MIIDIISKIQLHIGWKLKIVLLKIRHGKNVSLKWSDRIAFSTKFRINGSGRIILGDNVKLNSCVKLNVTDGGEICLEGNNFINEGTGLYARSKILVHKNTMFGPDVKIYDHDHDYRSEKVNKTFKQDEVEICSNVWIGANSIILRGSTLEDGCVIAAGTIVRGNVPSKTLYYTKREYGKRKIEKYMDNSTEFLPTSSLNS